MYYYLLCYGRTEFTKWTINSILKNSESHPNIILINNGWNQQTIPSNILSIWENYINSALQDGSISKVININSSPEFVLDAFKIADQDCPSEYYFVSDNDCIINTKNFDTILLNSIKKYSLQKLGVDFYRTISKEYCNKFDTINSFITDYFWEQTNDRLTKFGSEKKFTDLTNTAEVELYPNSNIFNNLSDTTLSIVKKGAGVSQNISTRISHSLSGLDMLHIGYLEPNYNSPLDENILENLLYQKKRYENMIEAKEDYLNRYNKYLELIKNKNIQIYQNYQNLIHENHTNQLI
jgi:hypothetical protein